MVAVRRNGIFVSTKTFEKINCSYRRWQSPNAADRQLRHYSLTVKVILETQFLDTDKRVLSEEDDCIQEFKKLLDSTWRDKVILALDDPEIAIFKAMEMKGLIKLSLLPEIGAEMFSNEMFNWFKVWLVNTGMIRRVDVRAVEISEGPTSSSLYSE